MTGSRSTTHSRLSPRQLIEIVRRVLSEVRNGRAEAFKDAMHSYRDAALVEKERADNAEAQLDRLMHLQEQVVGRVWHRTDGETVATLNSIGSVLPDDTPLYTHPLPPPTPIPADLQWLAKFYDVADLATLVREQDKHLARVQAQLPPLKDKFPRTPREG